MVSLCSCVCESHAIHFKIFTAAFLMPFSIGMYCHSCMQHCYGCHFITFLGLLILMHDIISIPDALSSDKYHLLNRIMLAVLLTIWYGRYPLENIKMASFDMEQDDFSNLNRHVAAMPSIKFLFNLTNSLEMSF